MTPSTDATFPRRSRTDSAASLPERGRTRRGSRDLLRGASLVGTPRGSAGEVLLTPRAARRPPQPPPGGLGAAGSSHAPSPTRSSTTPCVPPNASGSLLRAGSSMPCCGTSSAASTTCAATHGLPPRPAGISRLVVQKLREQYPDDWEADHHDGEPPPADDPAREPSTNDRAAVPGSAA